MTKKNIAIITPVYNTAAYITDCMQSVQALLKKPEFSIEHIIVDDASIDNTAEVIKKNKAVNTKIINLKKRHGPAYARNLALKKSRADYIFCLDADDVIFQNAIKSLYEVVENTQALWLYGDFLRGGEKLNYQINNDYYGTKFTQPTDLLVAMLSGRHFFQQNSFFKHQLLKDHQYYDVTLSMAEDFDLAIRLLLNNHVPHYVPGPLYIHRFHSSNYTPKKYQKDPNHHRQDVVKIYHKYQSAIEKKLSEVQLAEVKSYCKKP